MLRTKLKAYRTTTLNIGFSRAVKSEYRLSSMFIDDALSSKEGDIYSYVSFCDNVELLPYIFKKGFPKYLLRPNKTKNIIFEKYRWLLINYKKPLADINFSKQNVYYNIIESLIIPNSVGVALADSISDICGEKLVIKKNKEECLLEVTKTLLAIVLYKREYGEYPEKLDDLVPEFLPNIPMDPFDGKQLRYDVDRKIVYSVGENLIDYGGSFECQEPSYRAYGLRLYDKFSKKKDAVFSFEDEPLVAELESEPKKRR